MSSSQGEGRQSPPPEQQTDAQQNAPPGDAKLGTGPEGYVGSTELTASRTFGALRLMSYRHDNTKDASEQNKDDVLTSNPEHPLDAHAEAKASKDGRGPGI